MANYFGTNINILRIEARLTIEELSEETGISVARLIELENGAENLTRGELRSLCPALKISEDDFLSRDIKQERENTQVLMKHGESRKNLNWYYGDKKKKTFYLISILVIIGAGLLCFFTSDTYVVPAEGEEINDFVKFLYEYSRIIYSCVIMGIATAVFSIIEIFRKRILKFSYWMIWIIIGCASIIEIIGVILIVPYLIYAFIHLFKRSYSKTGVNI